ncbi:S-layer homology domain-containing protein [Candidatus Dojkabacteria bacterium]|uniref:S-layer homology domain-containing protein n=1 Tax=Candidatus Dojkabacteria bacterium TaxID=2099670 RepID=A0A955RKP8_9BACT|nr:S-layer homology domain-containing protein [Candidatus Dojkabacteria bacterium]
MRHIVFMVAVIVITSFTSGLVEAQTLIGPPETIIGFLDVSSDHENYDAITYVSSNGIVSGYSDSTFRPENAIQRDQFTKILIETHFSDEEIASCTTSPFPDVSSDDVFVNYICLAEQESIVSGYSNGLYNSKNTITLGEASKILANSYGLTADGSIGPDGDVFKPFLEALSPKSVVPVSLSYISEKVTRAEIVEMIYRLEESVANLPTKTHASLKSYEDSKLFGLAGIESASAMLISPPGESYLSVSGMLPSPCYAVEGYDVVRDGFVYTVTLHISADIDTVCIQVLQPYEYTIPLNAYALQEGAYQILINESELFVEVGTLGEV